MIVQICLSFFGRGAVMRRARQEVKALLQTGYKVVVITDLLHRKYLNYFKTVKNKPYIIPIKLTYLFGPTRKVISELTFVKECYRVLKMLLKNESIELIVCHSASYCLAVGHFARKNHIPSVFVIQELINERILTLSNPYNWWTTQLYKHATRYALSKIDYFIADSNYIKKFIINEGVLPNKTFILHNPVDLSKFGPKYGIQKQIDILFIGRLSIEKGVEVLINAFKFVSENRKILIIGDGPLYKKLEIMTRNTSKNIKFQGWVDNEELPNFIRKAKILVVPSLSEPQGVVVIEAMACGIPVIGSNTGGIPDMIEHDRNGWLVEPNNPEILGKTIERVLSNENLIESTSKEALKTALKFSLKNFSKNIVSLFDELIKDFKKR